MGQLRGRLYDRFIDAYHPDLRRDRSENMGNAAFRAYLSCLQRHYTNAYDIAYAGHLYYRQIFKRHFTAAAYQFQRHSHQHFGK